MPETNEYETDDIYLAAYFKICGCVMEKRRKVGNKVLFVFTNTAGSIRELRESYYSGKAKVDPHTFQQSIIAYKKLCHE